MKILFASTPATGHINPLLAIVHMLRAEGHEITFLTGSAFRDRIENSGAKFVSLQGGADFDGRDILGGLRTEGHSAGTRMVPGCYRAILPRSHPGTAPGPATGGAGISG